MGGADAAEAGAPVAPIPFSEGTRRHSTGRRCGKADVWLIVAAFFVARLYNIDLSAVQVATITAASVLMSIGGIGLPSGASFFAPFTPVFLAVGLSLEAIAILFAVDTIPDMVETVTNVTADMTAAAVVSRHAVLSNPSVSTVSP
ncbi:MAG TPA: cation:dicarboxylase symporter family transporter [Blastocatellia bacterium]|nr:cation:dicarboxylase symporter family transporter [Blastocatellia bacterium]